MAGLDFKTVENTLKSSNLSVYSVKQYITKLQGLMKHCGGRDIDYIIDHPKEVVTCIKSKYPELQTQKAYIASVRALFKHIPDLKIAKPAQFNIWDKYAQEVNESILKRYEEGKATQKQLDAFIPWNMILKKQQQLSRTEYASKRHLLLSMYTLEEPKRQDYGQLKIYYLPNSLPNANFPVIKPTTPNYLLIASDRIVLVMNEYKTSHIYERLERTLSPELTKIIKTSLKQNPREYLFTDKMDQPYKNDNSYIQFSNRALQSIFDRPVTVSALRHSFIEYMYRIGTTHKQRIEMSKSMGHSISMQSQYAFDVGDNVKCRLVCKPGPKK